MSHPASNCETHRFLWQDSEMDSKSYKRSKWGFSFLNDHVTPCFSVRRSTSTLPTDGHTRAHTINMPPSIPSMLCIHGSPFTWPPASSPRSHRLPPNKSAAISISRISRAHTSRAHSTRPVENTRQRSHRACRELRFRGVDRRKKNQLRPVAAKEPTATQKSQPRSGSHPPGPTCAHQVEGVAVECITCKEDRTQTMIGSLTDKVAGVEATMVAAFARVADMISEISSKECWAGTWERSWEATGACGSCHLDTNSLDACEQLEESWRGSRGINLGLAAATATAAIPTHWVDTRCPHGPHWHVRGQDERHGERGHNPTSNHKQEAPGQEEANPSY